MSLKVNEFDTGVKIVADVIHYSYNKTNIYTCAGEDNVNVF